MDYKNFLLRSYFSFLFIILYFIIFLLNFSFIFYLILFLYLCILIEVHFYFNKYKILPIIYILISLIFLFFLNFEYNNFYLFNIFVFAVILFDSFSYIIGKSLGKNKLIKISPNKTVEGFLGGFLLSLSFTIILSYYLGVFINFKFLIFIILIILSAFIGDIIESYFKRKNNLKNSSELIPGHGGIFDRFDSFLFSIIFYCIFVNILS